MSDDTAEILDDLLDRMRESLRDGALDAVARLGPQIETLLAGLTPVEDPRLLQRLLRKAQRNARLLQASGRGIRAAQRRLTEIASARAGLAVYDRSGKRAETSLPGGNIAQRF